MQLYHAHKIWQNAFKKTPPGCKSKFGKASLIIFVFFFKVNDPCIMYYLHILMHMSKPYKVVINLFFLRLSYFYELKIINSLIFLILQISFYFALSHITFHIFFSLFLDVIPTCCLG